MHHCKCSNKRQWVMAALTFLIVTSGCFQKKSQQESEIDKSGAPEWTDTLVGSWYIRLHSPEPGDQPSIWEGPLEIGDKRGTFFCRIDTSLIKGVRLGPMNNILVIEAFSGNQVFDVMIDVDSCKAAAELSSKPD